MTIGIDEIGTSPLGGMATPRPKTTARIAQSTANSLLPALLALLLAASPADAQSRRTEQTSHSASYSNLVDELDQQRARIDALTDLTLFLAQSPQAPPQPPPPDLNPAAFADLMAELEEHKARIAALEMMRTDQLNTADDEEDDDGPIKLPVLTPLSLGKRGDITFKPGLRIQPRYIYDDVNNNSDFFIRRFRIKAGGDLFGFAKYYTEFKFDGTSRFVTEAEGAIENAWVDFRVHEGWSYLRVGLYDVPFSRNLLVSDSKQLLMERALITSALTRQGLADNTLGLLLHGRPFGGVFEYYVGLFDNVIFEPTGDPDIPRPDSNQLMPGGRFVINLLDPQTPPDGYGDYMGSYIGQGRRLAIGVNAAHLGSALTFGDLRPLEVHGWGVDLFFNAGPWVMTAEYDWLIRDFVGRDEDIKGYGWFVEAGYLLGCFLNSPLEVACRYEVLDENSLRDDDRLKFTTVGLNYYIRDHNLKIQTDYVFRREQLEQVKNNAYQLQLQLDY